MRIVVDSSVLIDLLRGHDGARFVLADHASAGNELWAVVITRAEVLAGMRSSERAVTRRLLDRLRWLDIDMDLADEAGAFARAYRRSHRGLDLADCLIAAGVVRLGATLLTQNVRHFPMLHGLQRAYS